MILDTYNTKTKNYKKGTAWLKFYIQWLFVMIFIVYAIEILPKAYNLAVIKDFSGSPLLYAADLLQQILLLIIYIITYKAIPAMNKRSYSINTFSLWALPLISSLAWLYRFREDPMKAFWAFMISAFIISAVWTIPNIIYFKKRKDLFLD